MQPAMNDQVPRKLWRGYMLGLVEENGIFVAVVPQLGEPLLLRKLVASDRAPLRLRLNGELMSDSLTALDDGTGCDFDIGNALPLLRHGDRIEVDIDRRDPPSERPRAALVGGYWDPTSCVLSHELDLDSGRALAPGELAHVQALALRSFHPDRFWAPPSVRGFTVEALLYGNRTQLVRAVAAEVMSTPAFGFRGVVNAGLTVTLSIRCVADRPTRFRGKLIGDALR